MINENSIQCLGPGFIICSSWMDTNTQYIFYMHVEWRRIFLKGYLNGALWGCCQRSPSMTCKNVLRYGWKWCGNGMGHYWFLLYLNTNNEFDGNFYSWYAVFQVFDRGLRLSGRGVWCPSHPLNFKIVDAANYDRLINHRIPLAFTYIILVTFDLWQGR